MKRGISSENIVEEECQQKKVSQHVAIVVVDRSQEIGAIVSENWSFFVEPDNYLRESVNLSKHDGFWWWSLEENQCRNGQDAGNIIKETTSEEISFWRWIASQFSRNHSLRLAQKLALRIESVVKTGRRKRLTDFNAFENASNYLATGIIIMTLGDEWPKMGFVVQQGRQEVSLDELFIGQRTLDPIWWSPAL